MIPIRLLAFRVRFLINPLKFDVVVVSIILSIHVHALRQLLIRGAFLVTREISAALVVINIIGVDGGAIVWRAIAADAVDVFQ